MRGSGCLAVKSRKKDERLANLLVRGINEEADVDAEPNAEADVGADGRENKERNNNSLVVIEERGSRTTANQICSSNSTQENR